MHKKTVFPGVFFLEKLSLAEISHRKKQLPSCGWILNTCSDSHLCGSWETWAFEL